jgi:(p)ppGpp synthase/HD superfamily hydrolase
MKIQGPINTKAVIAYCHSDKAYQEALKLAEKVYKTRKRNFTGINYFSHPTTVASLLLETATQSSQMVASALMDLLKFERVKPSTIQTTFGADVLVMVQTLTPVRKADGTPDWKAYGEQLQAAGYPIQTIKVAALLDHVCAIPKNKLSEAFEQLAEVDELLPYLQGANAELLRRLTVALRNARA